MGEARLWAAFVYQTDGLWTAQVWGHPVYLVSYRDVPVEEDTIPLHLLDRDPGAPRDLVQGQTRSCLSVAGRE